MIKVYWLDLSQHFWSCCLLRVCCKFGLKLASHYKPVDNEVKFVELSKPWSVNKSSIKKQIIVRQTVQSMCSEQTFAQLRTGFRATISSVNNHSYPTNGKINGLCAQTEYKVSIENIYIAIYQVMTRWTQTFLFYIHVHTEGLSKHSETFMHSK